MKTMTYERFVFIRNHFRLTEYMGENETSKRSIHDKTNNIVKAINKMFSNVYVQGQNICIDESTIGYRGNFRSLVYNPSKPEIGEFK